ncbi:MAG: phosphoribosyltransferase [Coriobacteriia bacterium]
MFTDRIDAGRRLAEALRDRMPSGALVLGIPRGGVIVAAEVARALGHDLDIEVVRKIGAPGNPEYAIAAVDAEGELIAGEGLAADAEYLHREAERAGVEIRRRLAAYRGDRPTPVIAERTVVLVDDGVATGLTLIAAVRSLRRRGAARIIAAAPVASPSAEQALHRVADDTVLLWVDPHLQAVGQYYTRFGQTSDDQVVDVLRAAWHEHEQAR